MLKKLINLVIIILPFAIYAGDEYEKHKSELFIAAYTNNYQLMKNALDNKIDVNTICHDMFPAIHAAAQFSDQKCLNLLISAKADLSILDAGGRTCLHWAIDSKHDDVIKLLVDAGVDMSIKSDFKEEETALDLALAKKEYKKAKKLIYSGFIFEGNLLRLQIDPFKDLRTYILSKTLIPGELDIFFNINDECVNHEDKIFVTALFYACARGNLDILKFLLNYSIKGCLKFYNESHQEDSPFALAKEYKHANVVKLLLDYAKNYSELIAQPSGLNNAVAKVITEYALGDGYFFNNDVSAS